MDARNPPDWSLVEQQCPQLQALAMDMAVPLYLTALTSLTCQFWLPQHTDSFQCSRLGHFCVLEGADLRLLPGALTSLSLHSVRGRPYFAMPNLPSQQSLVHICFFHICGGVASSNPGPCASHSHCASHFCDVC